MYNLKPTQPVGTDTTHELLKIWIARYLPDLGSISSQVRHHTEERLRSLISTSSRRTTAEKLKSHLASDCTQAATDTQKLLLAIDSHIDTWQLKSLSTRIYGIYSTLITDYAESFIFYPVIDYLHTIDDETERLTVTGLVIPRFESLLLSLGPLLRELKAVYFSSINHHLLGFMTTQIHFTRQRVLSHLTIGETIWLEPYLQLLDELICIPWQHTCSVVAATEHRTEVMALVTKMLPKMSAISAHTYQKALRTYPGHTSYQGRIQSAAVQSSSLRDLNMFQIYIWLCVLEDSTAIIERKLLPICLQVFPLTRVSWDLVNFAIATIIDAIKQQLTPAEIELLQPYSDDIKTLFFEAVPQPEQISLLNAQLLLHDELNGVATNVSYTWKAEGAFPLPGRVNPLEPTNQGKPHHRPG